MKRVLRYIFILTALLLMLTVSAQAKEAEVLSDAVTAEGFSTSQKVCDGNRGTYSAGGDAPAAAVSHDGGVAGLYIEFDRIPQNWTLTDTATGKSIVCGTNAFLHEYVDVKALFGYLPTALKLDFAAGTAVAEIYALSEGELPHWVQNWNAPCEQADLLLLTTHSDDEQLFFAGILPYYAVERQLQVQVVYGVQHFEVYGSQDHRRPHEQLDGLWTVGIRNYPVIPTFPDLYSESLEQGKQAFQNAGVAYEDFIDYITDCLRRFKPLVVVSHDLQGEYGHGAHMVIASALTEAVAAAADETRFMESAARYGTWQVEKTYLHLYEENPIVMDWDTPYESLGGKTPFQVTQDGFACHTSQHWTWFYGWIYGKNGNVITRADQIRSYSPCQFGLYQSTVGADAAGGDFMENVKTYAQRQKEAEEKAAAEEAERLRLEQEAAAKAEAERLRQEQEAAEQAAREKRQRQITALCLGGAAVLTAGAVVLVLRRGKKGRREA